MKSSKYVNEKRLRIAVGPLKESYLKIKSKLLNGLIQINSLQMVLLNTEPSIYAPESA